MEIQMTVGLYLKGIIVVPGKSKCFKSFMQISLTVGNARTFVRLLNKSRAFFTLRICPQKPRKKFLWRGSQLSLAI